HRKILWEAYLLVPSSIFSGQVLVKLIDQDLLRCGSHYLVHDLSIFYKKNGRDAADSKFDGKFRIVVYVYFANECFAFIILGEIFDDRADHFARSAPFSPEIDQSQTSFFQYFILEICVC